MSEFDPMFKREIDGFNNAQAANLNVDQAKLEQQVSKMDTLNKIQKIQTQQFQNNGNLNLVDTRQLIQILGSKKTPEFNNLIVNMLLNLNNSILDGVAQELMQVMSTELGGDMGIDISFLNQLIRRLDDVIKGSAKREVYAKDFQKILSNSTNQDPTIKATIKKVLQGINQLINTQQTSSYEKTTPQQSKMTAPTMPSSTNMVLEGSMQMSGLDGIDNLVFEKNTIQTKDGSIKVEKTSQNSVVADVEVHKNHQVVGHATAFGTLNNIDLQRVMTPYISAIIQIANIQPLFFISSVASQMLVQMGRLIEDPNMYKVAIVTDNVAALREIDPVDYIRKVPATDQPQYAIYEKYKELYEEGYHYIISLHLNPNLKKTYKAALEAKKQVDDQNINDLEIQVYNTNANGVGLGLMIYELVDAIKNNYSPMEVNKLTDQLVKNYRHWVCPLEFDFVKNHQWVMGLADTQKKVQMRLFHFIPVIELDRKLTIVNVSYTKEAAFATLMGTIDEIISSKKQKINRICVEYRGVFREAIKIRNQIKVKCPHAKVSLQSVGSLTTQFFGPELVGICII
ncbi:MAG: DegV family protein [Candidatus Margulisiibacteriota bacterium]